MPARPTPLTTTSYAILGLLALRPWTSYELTKQMDRSLSHFWPRAESKLYEEPKKLVAHGLAKSRGKAVGRRTSTVYSITPRGRRALRHWLAQPGAGPTLEFELLLKVFFSDCAGKPELLAAIAAIDEWAAARTRQNVAVARGYAEGTGEFPERVAVTSLVGSFLTMFWDCVADWSARTRAQVETWPDDVRDAEPDWDMIREVANRSGGL